MVAADCPFSVAQDYATDYLRAAETGGQGSAIRLRWPIPLPRLERHVAVTFGLHFDVTEGGRSHDEIRFHWESGSRLLPDFKGTLRFRINGGGTQIVLEGAYVAPLGTFGRAFDRIIGSHVARSTLHDLGERIARYLAARQQSWLHDVSHG